MGRLTTHVLDSAQGRPGAGIPLQLFREGELTPLVESITNPDGRCDAPLLADAAFSAGHYRLVFHVADYFRRSGLAVSEPPFLDRITLEFAVADGTQHYHVPLVVSPWSYSTYRGS